MIDEVIAGAVTLHAGAGSVVGAMHDPERVGSS
jgi:hypothetical protein